MYISIFLSIYPSITLCSLALRGLTLMTTLILSPSIPLSSPLIWTKYNSITKCRYVGVYRFLFLSFKLFLKISIIKCHISHLKQAQNLYLRNIFLNINNLYKILCFLHEIYCNNSHTYISITYKGSKWINYKMMKKF